MSQKKVDAYKQEKANREKIMKKEKAILRLEKCIAAVICAAVICWVGFSIYDKTVSEPVEEKQDTQIDTTALDDYLNGLNAE
ncbi:MAG: hypothetical protein IJ899_15445 [Blautia sp.]|nr:hypothetical protein [Blautia sp.]